MIIVLLLNLLCQTNAQRIFDYQPQQIHIAFGGEYNTIQKPDFILSVQKVFNL